MVQVNFSYVYFSAGEHQRQPRSGSGGLTPLESLQPGTSSPGDTLPQILAPNPWPETINGITYVFSFWNISGGSLTAGGPTVGVQSFNTLSPANVFVGNLPITGLAIYVAQTTGGSGTGSGATIDQLDVTTNQLIDDSFVTVAPDASGTLTTTANSEGYVDTTNSSETITALASTTPTDVDFAGWVNLGPPAVLSTSLALAAPKGNSLSALALYQVPQETTGAISGTVTYDSDGGINPLGLLVTANPGGSTHSDGGDGSFTLTNVPAGSVQVTAALSAIGKRLYAPPSETTTVTVVAGQTTTVNFQFVRRGTTF